MGVVKYSQNDYMGGVDMVWAVELAHDWLKTNYNNRITLESNTKAGLDYAMTLLSTAGDIQNQHALEVYEQSIKITEKLHDQ